MDNSKNISNLDFVSIKSSLIDFLNKQEEFRGYSFEGSALNVLMDLLAYNTYYNGMYNNIVLNETFLDTATKRSSVVSIAKNLGYTPKSATAAVAKINIVLDLDDYTERRSVIPRNTIVKAATTSGTTISFATTDVVNLIPYQTDPDTEEVLNYAALNVEIKQGVFNTFSHVVVSPTDKILLPYENIDLTTLRAFVLNDISDTTGVKYEWRVVKDFASTNPESRVFFINEGPRGFYEAQFGDGTFGRKLEQGNVILFEFLLTTGAAGNDIGLMDDETQTSFSITGDPYQITTVQYSQGGTDREDIETIRRNALRSYSTQDRAVTATDYEAEILKYFSTVESVRCWGGEDNNPPEYGKVFASIKPFNAPFLSAVEKANMIDFLITNRATTGVTLQIVDPDIMYLNLLLSIKYDSTLTNDNEMKIKDVIKNQCLTYAFENYSGFDDDFYSSELSNAIAAFHPSIVSANVEGEMEKRIYPTVGITNTFTIQYENEIYHPEDDFTIPSIKSSPFYYSIVEQGAIISKLCYIEDLNGVLKLYYESIDSKTGKDIKIYILDIGTINYKTGSLIFTINVNKFFDDLNYVAIIAKPKDTDIFTDKDTILSFDKLSPRNFSIEMKKVSKNTVQNSSSATRNYRT